MFGRDARILYSYSPSWHIAFSKEAVMKPEVVYFSFEDRAAEKAAARAIDEAKLQSGEVSRAIAGPHRKVRAFLFFDAL
jgi:hypothetical protein